MEKEACYTNGQGILQTTSKVIPPPGYALEDTVVLLKLAAALGAGLTMKTAADVRADLATMAGQVPGLAGIDQVAFAEVEDRVALAAVVQPDGARQVGRACSTICRR